jgi:hypothetical protein
MKRSGSVVFAKSPTVGLLSPNGRHQPQGSLALKANDSCDQPSPRSLARQPTFRSRRLLKTLALVKLRTAIAAWVDPKGSLSVSADNQRIRFSATPGAHSAYFDEQRRLVIEWHDFGDHAPYESANMLIFEESSVTNLAEVLGCSAEGSQLLDTMKARFASYFEVQEFANEHRIAFEKGVDFNP